MTQGEMILYTAPDGKIEVQLRALEGTVWLTQAEIAKLFDKKRSTVAEHIGNILKEGELEENPVCRNFRRTAEDGKSYSTVHYNLDMILSVGYRVKSTRGIQFRQWATTTLKEYLVKGFAMNDERLKQTDEWDYFDEWLERIRDIRASEKRFYQKVKDIYATAVDYDKNSEQAQIFFKKVQNKMLWAVTGQTAAEIIAGRSDPEKPHMGLTAWKGSVIRKGDVGISKNYLNKEEMGQLNHIVTMYLDYAEMQAQNRKTINMRQWEEKLDAFLEFNDQKLLGHAGQVEAKVAKALAEEHYDKFDSQRKKREAIEADREDIKEIEELSKKLSRND